MLNKLLKIFRLGNYFAAKKSGGLQKPSPYYFVVTKDGWGFTIWNNEEIHLHLPDKKHLSPLLGMGFSHIPSLVFSGKVLPAHGNRKLVRLKEGMTIRLFHDNLWIASHPIEIIAVYTVFHIENTYNARKIFESIVIKNKALLARGISLLGEDEETTSALVTFFGLAIRDNYNSVLYNSLKPSLNQKELAAIHKLAEAGILAFEYEYLADDEPKYVNSTNSLTYLLLTILNSR